MLALRHEARLWGGLALIVAVGCVLTSPSEARAQRPAVSPELAEVRTALEKYADPYVALGDGYQGRSR